MPAPQLFLEQDSVYRESVLPPSSVRVSIEAGLTAYWRAWVGERGLAIGVDRFGESAPYEALQDHFGLTPDQVAARVRQHLAGSR
jgi:transketolase